MKENKQTKNIRGGGAEPLVSVLIPCYNNEEYVEEAVRSILKQSYKNLEVICLDDCSTDSTLKILERISQEDERVKLIKNSVNQGRPFARNKLVTAAKGAYIAWLDSDDVALPSRIEAQLKYLLKNKNIKLCGTMAYFIDKDGKNIGKSAKLFNKIDAAFTTKYGAPMFNPSVMGEAKVFKDNPYNQEFLTAQDYELWIRLVFHKKIHLGNLNKRLIKYRFHSKQITSTSHGKQEEAHFKAVLINGLIAEKDIKAFKNIYSSMEENVAQSTPFAKEYLSQIYADIKEAKKAFPHSLLSIRALYIAFVPLLSHFIKMKEYKTLLASLTHPTVFLVFCRAIIKKVYYIVTGKERKNKSK